MALSKLVVYLKLIWIYITYKKAAGIAGSYDCLVISPGGVGTTFLMEHLNNFVKINASNDSDNLKHSSSCPDHPKIIYVTGNDDDIYNSLKRRRWLRNQSVKIRSIGGLLFFGRIQKYFFLRAVNNQKRVFTKKGVLVVDYDDIWDSLDLIKNYLDINDETFVKNFPERKNRTSK